MTNPIVPVESMEVPASADNGNVPAESVAPVAPSPAPAAPVAPAEPAAPAPTAEPEQFELPDGRKVDAAGLAREFKENFLPDYTRKSQELAKLTQPPKTEIIPQAAENPLKNPEYAPKDYDELANIIEARTLKAIEAREQKVVADRQAIETAVTEQLNAVKAIDKTVDENRLFLHATKYRFSDLRVAHQNMRDMEKAVKDTKQATAKDVLKRNDPVSIVPGGSGGQKADPSAFENARDYLRSLQS